MIARSRKAIIRPALIAAIETSLMLVPLGLVIFYPFILPYELNSTAYQLLYCAGCMLGCSAVLSLFVLVPTTFLMETGKRKVSRKEMAGALGAVSLVLVLGATLIYKGFTPPGDIGKLLLFGLLMTIMAVTWTYTLRYEAKTKHYEAEGTAETAQD